MKSEVWQRPHAFMILYNLKQFLFVLLLPLLRGFSSALQGGMQAWLSGAWLDILALLSMLLLSATQWFFCTYCIAPDTLRVRQGVLFRTSLFILRRQVSTVSATRLFYLRPIGAVRLRADTIAGGSKKADFSLFVSKAQAEHLLRWRADTAAGESALRQYRPHSLSVLALSVFSSSSFAGIFFLSTLISQSGQLLGREFSDRVMGTFENVSRLLAFGLPPAAAAVGYLLLFGWLIAFLINFLRHKNFCLRRRADSLQVTGGIFTIREYTMAVEKVNYLDIRQSVLSCILRFCTVSVNAVGYQKNRDDVSGVIPAVKKQELSKTLSMFFPEFRPIARQLRHNYGALFKFIGDASWGCVLIPAATLILRYFLPGWADFIGWVGFMLCFPAYWFLVVRLIDYFTSGLAREENMFTLRYSSGYYLHTVVIPLHKISYVKLRQSPIQSFDKKCDVLIYSFSEGRTRHHIRNLDRQAALTLFGL